MQKEEKNIASYRDCGTIQLLPANQAKRGWIVLNLLKLEKDDLLFRASCILLFYLTSFILYNDFGCDWFLLIQKPDSSSSVARERRSCAFCHYCNRPLGFTNDSYHTRAHMYMYYTEADTQSRTAQHMHAEKVTSLRHQMPHWFTVFPSLHTYVDRWTHHLICLAGETCLKGFYSQVTPWHPGIINLTWCRLNYLHGRVQFAQH